MSDVDRKISKRGGSREITTARLPENQASGCEDRLSVRALDCIPCRILDSPIPISVLGHTKQTKNVVESKATRQRFVISLQTKLVAHGPVLRKEREYRCRRQRIL